MSIHFVKKIKKISKILNTKKKCEKITKNTHINSLYYLEKNNVNDIILKYKRKQNRKEIVMLKEKLLEDLKECMKTKNIIRKNVIQMVRAAILQVEKDKQITLEENQIIDIIAKESKKRKDSLADYEKSGREDLISQVKEEIEVLAEYLPKQLSIEEIEEVIKQVIQEENVTSMKDMGKVMKGAKEKIGAAADGKTINEVVKRLLA